MMLRRLWCNDEGVLTFEWIMLLTLLVIGVIGGVAAIRDAVLHESEGVVGAALALDQGYFVVSPLGVTVSPMGSADSANCTSGAQHQRYGDLAFWGTGRWDQDSYNQNNQTDNSTAALCPVP